MSAAYPSSCCGAELPRTQYARSGDVNVAYQVFGEGPFDLVVVPGTFCHVELGWQVPQWAAFWRRLAQFARVIIFFDKRGSGMSDRVAGTTPLETRMDDVRAVMDAAGSERAALFGISEGVPMSLLFAATYPQRAWALVLWGGTARLLRALDYPWGWTREAWEAASAEEERRWSEPGFLERAIGLDKPEVPDDYVHSMATLARQSLSPGAMAALNQMNMEMDVRGILHAVPAPTLMCVREGDSEERRQGARYIAEHVPRARLAEVHGWAHAPWMGDPDQAATLTKGFLDEVWAAGAVEDEPERVLATVLFTDIVGSTQRALEVGDRRWSELLAEHHRRVRQQLTRFRGREVDTAGDGFFATFDGPARAIRCARAIVDSLGEVGVEVRAGLHTGECEVVDQKVAGAAVHIGARVVSQAGPGEVLVSGTVKDLVVGSGIDFEDRGARELKGIPGEWRLYAVSG